MTLLALVTAILTGNLATTAVPTQDLATAILRVSRDYQVDAQLIARIVVVESRGRADVVNKLTGDYGLMQVNKATQIAYGFSDACMRNWRCNLRAGTLVLSDLLKMKSSRPCAYNVGPKGRFLKYREVCERYELKLASID